MNQSQTPRTLTSADRIRQLNEIDKDVAKLIQSAGLAVQALTNAKSTDEPSPPDSSLASRKTRFKEATSEYFALLSSIDVRLRRQVYALEEASILAPEPAVSTRSGDTAAASTGTAAAAANPLDISWLNSRKNTVGKDKEAELWESAREFIENFDKRPGTDAPAVKSENLDQKMEVD
ncbi:hypothetical protein ASPZODRAFT_1808891 [Penicilliopsis zonata CBS 506.65]|uniref:Mediator of RNA polymerase II transcription subunit 11 n=1 Tax=Penicilliopsis zonata CBS 506.65 TaxID=1073090 RepID=A0A1L9SLF1_9EURO|nr:hypothetical protein ASPZODRAFT_1808891 [Penicilliopsis zonata CBS 506.65]OJJ47914.1 hypothetical protein ASPZODRAFT_1808891 [Penicilliopsis zonata CBS 506.65]